MSIQSVHRRAFRTHRGGESKATTEVQSDVFSFAPSLKSDTSGFVNIQVRMQPGSLIGFKSIESYQSAQPLT